MAIARVQPAKTQEIENKELLTSSPP